jgi:hypothetical protein
MAARLFRHLATTVVRPIRPVSPIVSDGETLIEIPEEQAAIREMIRLRVKERQPLRVVIEAMAKRGHAISHQSVVNIVKRQGRGESCRSQ